MIYGESVRLRAIEKADLPKFVAWLNDPEVRQGLSINVPFSLTAEEKWFEANEKNPPNERALAIEIQPEGEEGEWVFVGSCSLFDFNWQVRQAEIGIHIGEKKYWNQGFGTRVMQLLLKHGFETLNLNRISLRVHEDNPRAVRTYEKAGFVKEGVLRQARFHKGKYIDVRLMSVLRSEWKERKK